MGIEIEAKMKVDDLSQVRSRIIAVGGTLVGEVLEQNVFFDTLDRKLLSSDKGLRIRKNHNVSTCEDSVIMTFKGPKHEGPLKSRDEYEVEVANLEDASRLIEAIGF